MTTMNATIGPFTWIIPVSSIATICVIAVYTLPKQHYLGLYFVVWWALAVVISLNNCFLNNPSQWSDGDLPGFVLMTIWPMLVLGILFGMYRLVPSVRRVILDIPAWSLILLQLNRISGASVYYHYHFGGHLPKYVGIQTAVLDVWVACTSIPLALLVKNKGLHMTYVQDWAWFWHSIGLFDMISALAMRILNFSGLGGEWLATPAVALLGFHPLALIILFQQSLAIGVHLLFVANTEQCAEVDYKRHMRLPLTTNSRHRY
jgi:hypothetical protein